MLTKALKDAINDTDEGACEHATTFTAALGKVYCRRCWASIDVGQCDGCGKHGNRTKHPVGTLLCSICRERATKKFDAR